MICSKITPPFVNRFCMFCAFSCTRPRYQVSIYSGQIRCAVTLPRISTFVYATQIVQSFNCSSPKFLASNHLLWLYNPVCVGPCCKPRRQVFLRRGFNSTNLFSENYRRTGDHIPNHVKKGEKRIYMYYTSSNIF